MGGFACECELMRVCVLVCVRMRTYLVAVFLHLCLKFMSWQVMFKARHILRSYVLCPSLLWGGSPHRPPFPPGQPVHSVNLTLFSHPPFSSPCYPLPVPLFHPLPCLSCFSRLHLRPPSFSPSPLPLSSPPFPLLCPRLCPGPPSPSSPLTPARRCTSRLASRGPWLGPGASALSCKCLPPCLASASATR